MRTEFWAVAAEQAAGVGVFFAAYFVSGYLPMGANIALSVVVGIGAFVGYLVCNHKDFLDGLWLFPLLFSAATGFAVGIYFCRFESLFFGNWKTAVTAAAIPFVFALIACFELDTEWLDCARNIVATLIAAGTIVLSVLCFCRWNADNAFFFREAAFVFLFLFFLLTGVCLYLWQGGDIRHKMNLAFCAAFFIILFIVLLIVSEGDAADGIGGSIDFGGGGGKVRKKRKGK